MDRKIAPPYHKIESIKFVEPRLEQLENGLKIASFSAGSQDVLKISLIFEAGTRFGASPIIPSLTNLMLREGTQKYSAEQIAEILDFYGTHLALSAEKDVAKVTLYTLTKHIKPALDILSEMVLHPTFPQDKLDVLLQKQAQKHQRNMQKVKYLANQKFTQALYGDHPYGKTIAANDFEGVSGNDLQTFFERYYTLDNCKIVIAGQYDEAVLNEIKSCFSVSKKCLHQEVLEVNPIIEHPHSSLLVEKEDAMQSALRIGKVLFNMLHDDYQDLKIANAVLGGYFGSRLMKNIREEKGYTYGIGSAIVSNQYSGFFTIMSEVNAAVSAQAVEEVRKEIKILRTELLGHQELEKVKSYMLGQLLRAADGAFDMSEMFVSAWLQGKDWNYHRQLIQKIQNVTPERIKHLMNEYLHEDSLLYVIAGK